MQEPWKRAAQLARARDAGLRERGKPPAAPRGPRRVRAGWLLALLLTVLFGGLAALWLWRGWWIPRYRDKLPQSVSTVIREPRAEVDWSALEEGLGVELKLFGNYARFSAATRDWPLDWQVTATSPNSLRIDGAGLLLYTRNGSIENYKIDVKILFASENASALADALRTAGLSPDLTWTALTGEDEMPVGRDKFAWLSQEGFKVQSGWVHREYVLYFVGGWLSAVEGRFKFGSSADEAAAETTGGVE